MTAAVILTFAAIPFLGDPEECQAYQKLVLGAELIVLTPDGEKLKVGIVVKTEIFTPFQAAFGAFNGY